MLGTSAAKTTLLGGALSALALHYSQQGFVAPVWGEVSFAVWCAVLVLPATLPVAWERRQIAWGLLSVFVFEYFVLFVDPDFKGWGDVYYFCGSRLQHCNCNFRWNGSGWCKALVLWNFVLSSALGFQKLIAQLGLKGLLPGEDVVTKDSFISILWRLIPYWLNNWEQQWGSECNSMMFELPHFALELLVILPCIQIVCGRLRILGLAPGQSLGQLPDHPAHDPRLRAHLAPDVLQGTWKVDARQAAFLPRLRANLRILAVVVGIAGLAAYNALQVPLRLESQIGFHPQTSTMLAFGTELGSLGNSTNKTNMRLLRELGADLPAFDGFPLTPLKLSSGQEVFVNLSSAGVRGAFAAKQCPEEMPLLRMMAKHADEISKMQAPEHRMLIPLVEVALGIMRLSCERFFVLASVLLAHVLFRNDLPPVAERVIRLNHRISTIFQWVILYTFPAVCWLYGAGFIFSAFVSAIFWGVPLQSLWSLVASNSTAHPRHLQDASPEDLERMNGSCAICWSDMQPTPAVPALLQPIISLSDAGLLPPTPVAHSSPQAGAARANENADGAPDGATEDVEPAPKPGKTLRCGHAFHEECILNWLNQCRRQGRAARCPMCNGLVKLKVAWRFPRPSQMLTGLAPRDEPDGQPAPRAAGVRPVQALLAELDPRLLIPGAAGMLPAFHNDLAAPNPLPALQQPQPAVVEQDANVAAWRAVNVAMGQLRRELDVRTAQANEMFRENAAVLEESRACMAQIAQQQASRPLEDRVNESGMRLRVVEDGIRWALAQMKNVGVLRAQVHAALEGVDLAATQATPEEQLGTIRDVLQRLRDLRLDPIRPRLVLPPPAEAAASTSMQEAQDGHQGAARSPTTGPARSNMTSLAGRLSRLFKRRRVAPNTAFIGPAPAATEPGAQHEGHGISRPSSGSSPTASNAVQRTDSTFCRTASASAEAREAARAAAISRSASSADNSRMTIQQPALTGFAEIATHVSDQQQQSQPSGNGSFSAQSQPSFSSAGPSSASLSHPLRSAVPDTHDSHLDRGFAASGNPSHQPTNFPLAMGRFGTASSPQHGSAHADNHIATGAAPQQHPPSLCPPHGCSPEKFQTGGPALSESLGSMRYMNDGAVRQEASSSATGSEPLGSMRYKHDRAVRQEASSSAAGSEAAGQAPPGRTRRPSLRHSFDRFLRATHCQGERADNAASNGA